MTMIEVDKRSRAAALRYPVWLNSQGASVALDGLTLTASRSRSP